jgi:prepilin-type N-terminal cleavage/methylation domain-containing protein
MHGTAGRLVHGDGDACHAQRPGFTLVELLVVIVVMAVLVLSATPKAFQLRREAHRATVAHTAAQFESAVAYAHLMCRVRGYAGRDDLPPFGAADLDFNAACFPSAGNGQSDHLNPMRCVKIWNGVLSPAPSIGVPPVPVKTHYSARASGSSCTYAYLRDNSMERSFTYDTATGAVRLANP